MTWSTGHPDSGQAPHLEPTFGRPPKYVGKCCSSIIIIIIIIITRTASHTTKYIHQHDSPPLLGGECIIPKSTQYVTVVTDITQ